VQLGSVALDESTRRIVQKDERLIVVILKE
jgi:hypothetical protein